MPGEGVEGLVGDRLDFVRWGAVDGAQVDPCRAELLEEGTECLDFFGTVIDPLDDENLNDKGSRVVVFEGEHPILDRLDVDAGVHPVDPFETAGGGAVEGEFDGVDLSEGLLDGRIGDGAAVAEDEGADIPLDSIDRVNKLVKVRIESRFAVGGEGEDIDIGVSGKRLPNFCHDGLDREDGTLVIDGSRGGKLTIDAVVVALLGGRAEVDPE